MTKRGEPGVLSTIAGREEVRDLLPPVAVVDSMPAESLPGLVAHLAALLASASARMLRDDPRPEPSAGSGMAELRDADFVADALGVPPKYVYELGRRGELRRVQFGKYVRFRLGDVSDWIEKHTETGIEGVSSVTYSYRNGGSGSTSHPDPARTDTSRVRRRRGSAPKQRRAVGAGRDGRPRDGGTADPNSGDAGAEEG